MTIPNYLAAKVGVEGLNPLRPLHPIKNLETEKLLPRLFRAARTSKPGNPSSYQGAQHHVLLAVPPDTRKELGVITRARAHRHKGSG